MYENEISLIQQGRAKEAIPHLLAMMPLRKQDPALHVNIALATADIGNLDQAERIYEMILNRWPTPPCIEAIVNYGHLLARQNRFEEAAAILELSSDRRCRASLAMVKIEQLRVDEALADMKSIAEESRNAFDASVYLGYSLHSPSGYDRQAHADWLKRFQPWCEYPEGPPSRWDGKRKIRIGFIGNRFCASAVASMLLPVFEAIDRDKFKTFVFYGNAPDAITERFKARATEWFELLPGSSDHGQCHGIRAQNIDVLIDTVGHQLGSRIMAIARRPAPVQFQYVGYAGDTLIGRNVDREVGWAWRPSDEAPPVVEPPSKRNGFVMMGELDGNTRIAGGITFGSVNRAAKINARVIRAWGNILASVPAARLIVTIKGGEKNTVARQTLVSGGIDADRLELVDRPAANADYLRLADRFDIHLDTFPYGGGATTCDMLWQGVPSIVLKGDEFQMGDKLLAGADLAGLVARDVDEYVAKASTFRDTLPELRATLRDRMKPLLDARPVAARLESLCVAELQKLAPAVSADESGKCCD